jgi:hypothetical protein
MLKVHKRLRTAVCYERKQLNVQSRRAVLVKKIKVKVANKEHFTFAPFEKSFWRL